MSVQPLVKTAETWALQVLFLTFLTTKVLLYLEVKMRTQSLSNCSKRMWMWMT
ncbi:Uncharacterised protein [Mycobacterium tuberculosis]|nr:Uncharacterised protein [Mycobacterium tuberculosis]